MGSRSNYFGRSWRGKSRKHKIPFEAPWFAITYMRPAQFEKLKTSKRFHGCRKGKP